MTSSSSSSSDNTSHDANTLSDSIINIILINHLHADIQRLDNLITESLVDGLKYVCGDAKLLAIQDKLMAELTRLKREHDEDEKDAYLAERSAMDLERQIYTLRVLKRTKRIGTITLALNLLGCVVCKEDYDKLTHCKYVDCASCRVKELVFHD